MKQNEINAVKAARGLDTLTGAAEMNADANIRLELLYERTAKAQGAFQRGGDLLVVQQEKLRATFANVQAELGAALIPAIAELFSELQPLITEATPGLVAIFEVLGEVMMFLVDVFTDFFDHTTEIGDSVIELGATFQFLVEEIGGVQITLQDVFDFIRDGIDFVIEGFSLLLVVIHNAVIVVKVLGQMFDALINQDWDRLFNTNWYGLIENTIAAADAARDARIEFARLAAAARASLDPKNLGDQTEIWDALASGAGTAGTDAGNTFGRNFNRGAAKTGKDFWEKLTEEIEKQRARMSLRGLGLSEALVESILGDAEWEKVFDRIISGGRRAARELQNMFNQTAAGIRELEGIQKEQMERAQAEAERRESMIQDLVQRSFDASMEKFEKFRELLKDFTSTAMSAFGAFNALLFPDEDLGKFEAGVVSLERSLMDLLEVQTELFSAKNKQTLQDYVTETAATMRAIGFARDELANQIEEEQRKLTEQVSGRKSMFETVFNRIMGSADVSTYKGTANSLIRQLRRTVDQAINFENQVNQLRAMGLTDRAISQIESAGVQSGTATARALLRGGESAIDEINKLYDKLGEVAETQAERQSSELYDSGIALSEGLIAGLLSQANQMKLAAEIMAGIFEKTFNDSVDSAAIKFLEPNRGLIEASTRAYFDWIDSLPTMRGGESRTIVGGTVTSGPGAGMTMPNLGFTVPDYSRPVSGGTPISIVVNAGMGADGQNIGQAIVEAIARYESRNGKVFASA